MSRRLRSTVALLAIGFFVTYIMNACGQMSSSAVSFSGGIQDGIIVPIDFDDDGLTDEEEVSIGTNPNNPDTDGDGVLDGAEVNTYETDPLVADSNMPDDGQDSDEDGLTDAEEAELGTDPNNNDSDGAGVSDGEEVARGLQPTDPTDDARLDPIEIQFLKTPGEITEDKLALFNFVVEGSAAVSEVQCYLDGRPTLEACELGKDHRLFALTVGAHAFKVAVRSEYGVLSTATYLWEVTLGDVDYCESGEVKKIVKIIRFNPTRQSCAFGENGNLSKKDRFIRAQHIQSELLDIPTNVKLCSVNVSIPKQKLRFDDHIILSWNNVALFTNADFVLSEAGAEKIFDFAMALNRAAFKSEKSYCFAGDADSLCQIPRHDRSGSIEMGLSEAAQEKLRVVTNSQLSHSLKLTVLGDNDRSDCQQTGLDVSVDITYGIGGL